MKYEILRSNHLVLGRKRFDTEIDASLLLQCSIPMFFVIITCFVSAALLVYMLDNQATVTEAALSILELLSNFRTVISFLLTIWFLAYQIMNFLVKRNVEANELLEGEICWKQLHKNLGEWKSILVSLPHPSTSFQSEPTPTTLALSSSTMSLPSNVSSFDVFKDPQWMLAVPEYNEDEKGERDWRTATVCIDVPA